MSANTIIRINIMDSQRKSMKGRRFSDIPSHPDTVSWILTRPSPTGQMADIVKFLNARSSAREAREARLDTARSMRAVYMISDDEHGGRTVVDAATVSELVKVSGRAAGGLRCEHGHVMKFVDFHTSKGSVVSAYFAHVSRSDEATTRAGLGGTGGTGRCSDVHLAAQLLIKNNISRIVATRFKSCGECTEIAFRPPRASIRAEIEVSERTSDDRMIRSDVVVYVNDERRVSFEVKHTHATGLGSRAGLPYIEVNAGHVVSQFESCASTATVRLKCENATTPCTSGCDVRRVPTGAECIAAEHNTAVLTLNVPPLRCNCAACEGFTSCMRIHSPEEQLRLWVEARYTHIAPSERDKGTKLPALYRAYKAAIPRVHLCKLEKWPFAQMLRGLYPGIDPGIGRRNGSYLLHVTPLFVEDFE